jgi:RNA polymerase sigma factor (sigma-70 family)
MQQHHDLEVESRQAAITAVFQRSASALFIFLLQRSVSREEAEDLLLETFTAALQEKRFCRMPETEQRTWLWRVARNKAIDLYRYHTRRAFLPIDQVTDELFSDEELSPESTAMRQEEYTRLHEAFKELSPLQQEVVRLRFVDNLRCAEIASLVGKTEKAVRMILSRTLNELRKRYHAV